MTIRELGQVVAERQFDAVGTDGSRTPVLVRIGAPVPDPLPGGDWSCPHQIVGLGDDAVAGAFGVDSLQALLLSVHSLRLALEERAGAAGRRLDWLGLADLGLTVDPASYLALRPGG